MPPLPALDLEHRANYSPHLVICGAGASRAATPRGDASGRTLPLMADLVGILDLGPLLKGSSLEQYTHDFELLYDAASRDPSATPLVAELKARVRDYFGSLRLPSGPTAYDYLLLSLREKDVIATFNWDPLLLQAYQRHSTIQRLPKILFLHGSVAVGVCHSCRVKGSVGARCPQCGAVLQPGPLLYPVADKDYTKDAFISAEWEALQNVLTHAYFLTIFGYSAPQSDVAAIAMLRSIWDKNEIRTLAEVEIVDVRERDKVLATWTPFITRSHWIYCNDIRDSYLAWHPRRSCEALAFATLQNDPWPDDWMPHEGSMDEVVGWIRPLLEEEERLKAEQHSLSGMGRRSR